MMSKQKNYTIIFFYFFFFLKLINIDIKLSPIHITLKENGASSKDIVAFIRQIITIFEKKGINIILQSMVTIKMIRSTDGYKR